MNKLDYILNAIMVIVMVILWVFFAYCRTYQFDWDLLVLLLALVANVVTGVLFWRQGKRKKKLEADQDEIQKITEALKTSEIE